MNLSKCVEELEWIYENMNEFLKDEEDLGETDVTNRIDPLVVQLRITINKMKDKLNKGA